MSNIGFIGLGKLGLPCALAVEAKGHKVWGYDINPTVEQILATKKLPYREIWAQDHLDRSEITFGSIEEVVSNSEIIFVPIQTPHDERFEGTTRIPEKRVDFDYSFLRSGIKSLADEIAKQGLAMSSITAQRSTSNSMSHEKTPTSITMRRTCHSGGSGALRNATYNVLRRDFAGR